METHIIKNKPQLNISINRNKPIGKQKHLFQKDGVIKQNKSDTKSLLSIDEQIAALENAVSDSESDYDSEYDNDSGTENNEGIIIEKDEKHGLIVEKDKFGNIIRIASSVSKDYIAPLETKYLPAAFCSKPSLAKNVNASFDDNNESRVKFADEKNSKESQKLKEENKRKRIHFESFSKEMVLEKNEKKKQKQIERELKNKNIAEMEEAAKKALGFYVPRSSEKIPFFCRVCQYQGNSIEEFEKHKLSETHAVATDVEKKMSFCRICRKQFTSINQLKEHLLGNSHKEKLASMKLQNSANKKFSRI
jgi:hypothetical protein